MSEAFRSMRRMAAALAVLAEELQLTQSPGDQLQAALVDALVQLADTVDGMREQLDELESDVEDLSSDLADVEDIVFAEKPAAETGDQVEILCPHCKRASRVAYDSLKSTDCRCPRCHKPLSFEGGPPPEGG